MSANCFSFWGLGLQTPTGASLLEPTGGLALRVHHAPPPCHAPQMKIPGATTARATWVHRAALISTSSSPQSDALVPWFLEFHAAVNYVPAYRPTVIPRILG